MSVTDQLPQRAPSYVGAWRAIVATNAADVTDTVFVTVPAVGDQIRYGPCRWMPRGDSVTFPTRGDEALIMFDEQRTPWIIAWWPF